MASILDNFPSFSVAGKKYTHYVNKQGKEIDGCTLQLVGIKEINTEINDPRCEGVEVKDLWVGAELADTLPLGCIVVPYYDNRGYLQEVIRVE